MSPPVLGTVLVLGYLLTGFLFMALVARFDGPKPNFDMVMWGTVFWPLAALMLTVWGLCVGLHRLFKLISGTEINFDAD